MNETTQPAVAGPVEHTVRPGAKARKPMRTKPLWRYALRSLIDLAALYCAWAIQFSASGSYAAATITAIAVGLYGMWCFKDGSA